MIVSCPPPSSAQLLSEVAAARRAGRSSWTTARPSVLDRWCGREILEDDGYQRECSSAAQSNTVAMSIWAPSALVSGSPLSEGARARVSSRCGPLSAGLP